LSAAFDKRKALQWVRRVRRCLPDGCAGNEEQKGGGRERGRVHRVQGM